MNDPIVLAAHSTGEERMSTGSKEDLAQLLADGMTRADIERSAGPMFGAAGASFAMVLLITQIWSPQRPLLEWSLGLAGVAVPLWMSLAMMWDGWLLTSTPYRIIRKTYKRYLNVASALMMFAGLCTLAALVLLIYTFSHAAAYWTVVGSIAAIAWAAVSYALAAQHAKREQTFALARDLVRSMSPEAREKLERALGPDGNLFETSEVQPSSHSDRGTDPPP